MVTVVRGGLTALVVVLLASSGIWATPVSAAAGLAVSPGTATEEAVIESSTAPVTTPAWNETETTSNTTSTGDSTDRTITTTAADNGTAVTSGNTTVADGSTAGVGDKTTVVDSNATGVDGNTAGSGGYANGFDGNATVAENVSVGEPTAVGNIGAASTPRDGLAGTTTVNGTASSIIVDASDTELNSVTISEATTADAVTATPTRTRTSAENARTSVEGAGDGATESGSDGGSPVTATSAVVVGFGAAAVTLLVRRSATLLAFGTDIATTASRLPLSIVQRWSVGREWIPRVLTAVGYSRYDDSDPLTHPTRAELYELIAASPGTYLSELSTQADVPTSTARHHLDVLVREGVVTTSTVRGKRRYFSLDTGDEAIAAALSDDASAAIIQCLADTGPASVSAIADDLDRDVSTVSHHLGRLAENGLVEREREGRSVYNELVPEVEDALNGDSSGRSPRRV
jgi:DNA-binding transcriptional ArsR family regulator